MDAYLLGGFPFPDPRQAVPVPRLGIPCSKSPRKCQKGPENRPRSRFVWARTPTIRWNSLLFSLLRATAPENSSWQTAPTAMPLTLPSPRAHQNPDEDRQPFGFGGLRRQIDIRGPFCRYFSQDRQACGCLAVFDLGDFLLRPACQKTASVSEDRQLFDSWRPSERYRWNKCSLAVRRRRPPNVRGGGLRCGVEGGSLGG